MITLAQKRYYQAGSVAGNSHPTFSLVIEVLVAFRFEVSCGC